MGLAIACGIVVTHSGEIGVESRLDRGSTFCFTLPDKKAFSNATTSE
ncbi:MAG: hypothetical protein WAV05_00595 [Anaerolineales bacterium]